MGRSLSLAAAILTHDAAHPAREVQDLYAWTTGLRDPFTSAYNRLRVDDIRVFYDVTETQVQVLAVVTKADAQAWLDQQGTREEGTA